MNRLRPEHLAMLKVNLAVYAGTGPDAKDRSWMEIIYILCDEIEALESDLASLQAGRR